MLKINNIEVTKSDLEDISSILKRAVENIENNKSEDSLYELKVVQRNLENNLREDDNEQLTNN